MNTGWTPEFELGETFYGIGGTPVAADSFTNLGQEWWFNDPNYNMKMRKMRLVRNKSGINLLPKMAVRFKTSTANDPCGFETEIDGYGATTAERIVLVDDQLPAAGVADGDVFWVCVEGEHLGITAKEADARNVINVGSFVAANSAAASTFSTTAGRLQVIDLSGATANLGNMILNAIGRAMTAQTTGNTNADIRVVLGRKW